MNKNIVIIALGVCAGHSMMAMQQQEQAVSWYDTLTSGKTFAMIGAAAGTAGAAYAVRNNERVQNAVQEGLEVVKDYGQELLVKARRNPGKAAALCVGSGAAGYAIYRFCTRNSVADKLEEPSAPLDELLAGNSSAATDVVPGIQEWEVKLTLFLTDVFGEDEAQIASYLDKALLNDVYGHADPHALLRETQLLDRLSKQQKADLFCVCYIFRLEYFAQKIGEFLGSLTDMQQREGMQLMNAMKSQDERTVVQCLNELIAHDALSVKQRDLLENLLSFMAICMEDQKDFLTIHKIKLPE